MKTLLWTEFQIHASHSLVGYETPHAHCWKVEVAFGGEPVEGKIIDLLEAREQLLALSEPLMHSYLNDHPALNESARRTPTSEKIGESLFETITSNLVEPRRKENPSLHVASIRVSLFDPDGTKYGTAQIFAEGDDLIG